VAHAVADPRGAAVPGVATSAPTGGGLAVVTTRPGSDGVAYVGRLLRRAMADAAGEEPWVVSLDPSGDGVTLAERARFAIRLATGQRRGDVRWMLFNHVGIARAQRLVPAPLRRPYAVFVHGIEVWPADLSTDRKRALREARLVVSNSAYTARRLMAAHPDVGPVTPCPLALLPDEPVAGTADASLLAAMGERGVLIVGRMSAAERYKGHDQLLECWPEVARRVPDARLVVAGGGDDVARLRRKASELGIADRVVFAGFVDQATLDALMRRAAVFAMPRRGEGFGIVYLEAMRAGVPCVAAHDDGAVDVVVDGETGVLVDRDDRAQLPAALVRLLDEPTLRSRMGAAGRRRYLAEFTYERFRDRFHAVFGSAFCA
jgi:phosphatidyl-myo-inositol dimannoside synthase